MKNSNLEYKYVYLKEADEDLDNYLSDQKRILKIIDRVKTNPLPNNEGGYGKPLGNKNNVNLTGCLKIKLKRPPIRIVYKLFREKKIMWIIAISDREDSEVYELASHRLKKYEL